MVQVEHLRLSQASLRLCLYVQAGPLSCPAGSGTCRSGCDLDVRACGFDAHGCERQLEFLKLCGEGDMLSGLRIHCGVVLLRGGRSVIGIVRRRLIAICCVTL